jgi:carbon monoxide dehydrogenase subunit G
MLEIQGLKSFDAPPERVWSLLLAPDVLRKCIPGCESLDALESGRFAVVLRVGHGIIKGRFRGEARLEDVVEGVSYRLDLKAKGPGGSIESSVLVRLVAAEGGRRTTLSYASTSRIGGLLRAFSKRFFEDAAHSLENQFFDALSTYLKVC